MEPKYTTAELRSMSGQLYPPVTQHDLGRAAAMLSWAADMLDQAYVVIAEFREAQRASEVPK